MRKIIDFEVLKGKIGVIDVAFYLGYKIDKRAGIGKYVELVSPAGNKIVVKNTLNKRDQTFFYRNGSKGGDVINFVQQHINYFGRTVNGDWHNTIDILQRLANEPPVKYMCELQKKNNLDFDINRWEAVGIDHDIGAKRLFEARGISYDTLDLFKHHILFVKDKENQKFSGFNVGFPYRDLITGETKGYELRGLNGFKSKAAGTNSTNYAWVVDFDKTISPRLKDYIFCTESALDAISFVQANRNKLDLSKAVFVSIGGNFSNNQITNLMNFYPNSKFVDAFDNDFVGKMYGIRLQFLVNHLHFEMLKVDNGVMLKVGDKIHNISEKDITPAKVAKLYNLNNTVDVWKCNKNYKDWNDFIMGKAMIDKSIPKSKHEMNHNLEKKRMNL